MANRYAILATAKAIRRLLSDACPKDDFPNAEFRILQAADIEKPAPQGEGISIYLYHVTANISRRNMPARILPNGKRTRPPLPLDLHFLLTPWSGSADTQLGLLGWAMRVLDDTPIIPANYLNYDFPGKEIFHPDETVELIFNPISMQDMAPLWEDLHQVKIMPSVTYVARLVPIESDVEIDEGGPVQTRILDMAQVSK
jgi:hypothetical protein